MTRGGFIALPSGATAYALAACARQPAVGELLRALRHCLKTPDHIKGERGRAVLRILIGCLLLSGAMAMSAVAENAPGVTDSEIKIGQTMPYTGPGAWLSSLGLAEKAYMQMINDQGGINGRKINLISVDWDAHSARGCEISQRAKNSAAVHRERRLPLGRLQGDALHDRRHAPELSTGRASLRAIHSPAGSKSKNLYPP
jgi:hypothetical protein